MKDEFIIGVGGHKCASTWISEFLRYHPSVFVTNPKEIHYFTKFYDKGKAWYQSHFLADEKIQCEFSSDYLYRKEACNRIKNHFGSDIKILISIRNPVDRAVSHIKHISRDLGLRINRIDLKDLDKLLLENPDIIKFSQFYEGIKRFQSCFGKNNVLVLSKDDLDSNCLIEIRRLCDFMQVQFEDPNCMLKKRESEGINPRFKILELLRQKIYYVCYEYFPVGISFVKKVGLSRFYRHLNAENSIVLTEEALDYLSDIFRDDWNKVKNLLDENS